MRVGAIPMSARHLYAGSPHAVADEMSLSERDVVSDTSSVRCIVGVMNPEALQAVALAVAAERSVDRVLTQIVQGLAAQPSVALARVWLIAPGDICETCPMRAECPDRTRCLHLSASAGRPSDQREDWSRLDGSFRRFPLGVRKIGRIGATGEGILIEDIERDHDWIARQDWVRKERLHSFGGQPLVFRNGVLGVLGLFNRDRCDRQTFAWLRTFADHAAIAIAHARALEEIEQLKEQLELENTYLREDVRADAPNGIIGKSPALRKVLEQVAIVAPTPATVLIQGESGTGKELVARALHDHSPRRHRPLIEVNCASIPRELFESEFFGHVKGAFTGALRDRAGRFQAAHGGTLFLDEVGEIPLELQAKLLRILQEGQFERVGEEVTRSVDVRVIAASNRDLQQEVAAGRFRRDLFYRLSVFPIMLPPLRERLEDVPALAAHFIEQAARRFGRPAPRLTARAVKTLEAYGWPGNVRELQHVIERAVLLSASGVVRLDAVLSESEKPARADSGLAVRKTAPAVIPEIEWRRRERQNLSAALQLANGRIYGPGGAAELLGVRPTTLISRLKALKLRDTDGHQRSRANQRSKQGERH
jgi:transcriptional regulator with GAF, ATPase, and Fis domain